MPSFPYPPMPGYPFYPSFPGFPPYPGGIPGSAPPQTSSSYQPMAALANAATVEIERQAEAERKIPSPAHTPTSTQPPHQQGQPQFPMWPPPMPYPGYFPPYMAPLMSHAGDANAIWAQANGSNTHHPNPGQPSHLNPSRPDMPAQHQPDASDRPASNGNPEWLSNEAQNRLRMQYSAYPASTHTSRHPSPELENRSGSESPPPHVPQMPTDANGFPMRSTGLEHPTAAAPSPVLAPFKSLTLLQQQQQRQDAAARSGTQTPASMGPSSRPASPANLPSLKLPAPEQVQQALYEKHEAAELGPQHALSDHHHHFQRPHRKAGPYAGMIARPSRPNSPDNLSQYSLSKAGSLSRPGTPPDLHTSLASRNSHGHLEDILNPSALPGSPASHPGGYFPRVSHTRSAPASRDNSPPGSPAQQQHQHQPQQLNPETSALSSGLGTRSVSWAKGFSMTPISGSPPEPATRENSPQPQ